LINIAADFQIPEIKSRLDDLLDTEYSLKFFDSSTVSTFDLKNIDALLRSKVDTVLESKNFNEYSVSSRSSNLDLISGIWKSAAMLINGIYP
jgi:hypothetical protein